MRTPCLTPNGTIANIRSRNFRDAVLATNCCRHSVESMAFPNVFTPNGTCEVSPCRFCPIEDKGFFRELKMEVYNKWGALVWKNSCKDPDCPSVSGEFWWDGRNKQGNVVSDGVYYWVLYGVPLSETNTIILNGSVTIMSN